MSLKLFIGTLEGIFLQEQINKKPNKTLHMLSRLVENNVLYT